MAEKQVWGAEQVTETKCACGEGPLWHPDEKNVYYTDIPAGALYRHDPEKKSCEKLFDGPALGGFTIQKDGSLLLFQAKGMVRHWQDGRFTTVINELPDERGTRFNDVAADPEGRVFCGTMPTENRPGRLYRLDSDGTLELLLEGIGCSNGIAFTPDLTKMYYTDSAAREIYLFDYDRATGAITNQRVFVTIDEDGAVPDGMTVDSEGGVWSALWDGGGVVRFSPDGRETGRVNISCRKASSVIFGGPAYEDLYITTAGGDGDAAGEGPGAGGLFHVVPGVRGCPEFRSRIKNLSRE
jgi:D-xylono/L-arabinono-1,4-lactonase